jgi:hypothetical protein
MNRRSAPPIPFEMRDRLEVDAGKIEKALDLDRAASFVHAAHGDLRDEIDWPTEKPAQLKSEPPDKSSTPLQITCKTAWFRMHRREAGLALKRR